MILPLLVLAGPPVPLATHGWEQVGSQAAANTPEVTMRFWLAPRSVQQADAERRIYRAAVAIETILVDGTQADLQIAGHLIDCDRGTWQVDWSAFAFDDKAVVSYPGADQPGQPKRPEPDSGMHAVIGRVCSKNEN